MIIKKNKYINFDKSVEFYQIINSAKKSKSSYKLLFFSLYMHKKLSYFRHFINGRFYNRSAGQLLKKTIKKIKFFKKSLKNFGLIINILNKRLNKKINSIHIFYCKNYNLKNYLWMKRFLSLIKPTINYTILSNSWNYIKKKRKRIKKKIFRNLLKKTKSV